MGTSGRGGKAMATMQAKRTRLGGRTGFLKHDGEGVQAVAYIGVLLRYERPETRTTAESPAPRAEGGRILFAWSAAAGAVPAAAHEAALRGACAHGHPEGEAALEVLPHASVRGLSDALRLGHLNAEDGARTPRRRGARAGR